MNGLAAVYGNHLGAQLLGLANAAELRGTTTGSGVLRPVSSSSASSTSSKRWLPEPTDEHAQRKLQQEDEDEYEDEVIEEMSGSWTSEGAASATTAAKAVPRVDSVEWSKMEEGPDDEGQPTEPAEEDELHALRNLKRKRKSLDEKDIKDEKSGGSGAELAPGKKRLSCIDCGCRAALKACTKVMCIDCCAKEGRVCNAHAKKLYEKEVRKLDQPAAAEKEHSTKDKEHSSSKATNAKKRARVRAPSGEGEQEDDLFAFAAGGEEESDGTPTPDRDTERDDAAAGEEEERGGPGAKAKRSVLYETIVKQDKKIRALQNDLKELRTLLLSVVDKQAAFSRQLRHISGVSDGLVIDEEDEEGEEDGSR